MQENLIDSLVAKIAAEVKEQDTENKTAAKQSSKSTPIQKTVKPAGVSKPGAYTAADYPLIEKHQDIVKTPTGKKLDEITLDQLMQGNVTVEDVRISAEMLHNQADIAESAGKKQVAQNLRRAAEMTAIEDDVVIKMYDMLRPNRATKEQLMEMADTLRTKYHADRLADLVTEACMVYEKRGILRKA